MGDWVLRHHANVELGGEKPPGLERHRAGNRVFRPSPPLKRWPIVSIRYLRLGIKSAPQCFAIEEQS